MKDRSTKTRLRRFVLPVVVALVATAAAAAAAGSFPTKAVRIIVPSAPGGAMDITARLVAAKMGERLGQTVIVENRPGGDTLLGTRVAKEAAADGYTILAQSNGFTILPSIKREPGYDPLKDFTPIGLMVRSPMMMNVGVDQPDRTVGDFVARAKANKLSFATGSVGGPTHIAAALFLQAAGLNLTQVPYKGNGAAMTDVVAGRIDMFFDAYISSAAFLKAGKLRSLGVTTSQRILPLPGVPTFKEQGLNFSYSLWLGLLVRSGTPKEAIQRLSDALRFALDDKGLNERFRSEGSDPSFVTPDEFGGYLTREVAQMEKLASDLNLSKE